MMLYLKYILVILQVCEVNGFNNAIGFQKHPRSTSQMHDTHKKETPSEIENLTEINDQKEKIRFRGRVTYDGSGFSGWQVQSKGRTGQGELEGVLSRRFNRTVKIVGAGRTDSGVHARGQAFHFDVFLPEITTKQLQSKLSKNGEIIPLDEKYCFDFCHQLQASLNSMLQQDMRVYNVGRAPPPATASYLNPDGVLTTSKLTWHAIYSAQKKLYSYRIGIGPTIDPIERYRRVRVEEYVEIKELQRILQHFEGTHDFRAFAGAIEATQRKKGIEHKDTVRTIYSIHLVNEGGGNHRIDILLKGALYKMVRNIVGTSIEVAMGRMEEAQLLRMLHHNFEGEGEGGGTNKKYMRKDNRCKPAAAEGLTMEMVYFEDSW